MGTTPKADELPMEEILASIRRMIAGEEPTGAASPGGDGGDLLASPEAGTARDSRTTVPDPSAGRFAALRPRAVSGPDRSTVLRLADVLDSSAPRAARAPAEATRSTEGAEAAAKHDSPPPLPVTFPAESDRDPRSDQRLLSETSDRSVGAAFGALARTLPVQTARSLEDLVADMLRPMLRSWLDDNLPPLVERLVRAEIERVARGS